MAQKSSSEKEAIELIEEAVHLLRLTPLSVWFFYFIGTLPFILGFLFFWADMSRSAFAEFHSGRAAFGLTLCFLWMKTWQTLFVTELAALFTGKTSAKKSFADVARIAFQQLILQPSGLILFLISIVIILPAGWVYAFYQNATVLGQRENFRALLKDSVRLAGLWPKQNHLVLAILGAFTFFVWLNMISLIAAVPSLLKTFLGIETLFTRGGVSIFLNTTFFAATFALTYLCIDPLAKAVYFLRCFYGQAVSTGEDLKVEIKSCAVTKTALVSILFFVVSQTPTFAQENSKTTAPQIISSSELNESIAKVSQEQEFTWRAPRQKVEPGPENLGWFATILNSITETVGNWMRSLRDVLRDFFRWLMKWLLRFNPPSSRNAGSSGWQTSLQILVYVLIALIACALVLLFIRIWQRRLRNDEVVVATAISSRPDLSDENVAANQLPEDEWLRLARECMAKGELRLALRAFYLAGLAHLGHRQLIRIAKFKSNREYENELRRRARALPDLQTAFGKNVFLFDRSWYGRHEVTQESLQDFQTNLERIRSC